MPRENRPGGFVLQRVVRAEFRKIWDSRLPLVFLLAIPVGCSLVVFELYHVERLARTLQPRHAIDALPVLFFGTWKLMLFQAAVLAFSAFWATVDSQYGMARVVFAQPLSRFTLLAGRWIGLGLHLVIAACALMLSLAAWAALYSGTRGIGPTEVGQVLRSSAEVVLLTLALGGVALAAGSFRRTVSSGMVTAMIVFIGLAAMMMLPFDVVPPRFVFVRYWFYPMQELPNPFPFSPDSPFVRIYPLSDFLLTVVGTPLVLAVLSFGYVRRRDITE